MMMRPARGHRPKALLDRFRDVTEIVVGIAVILTVAYSAWRYWVQRGLAPGDDVSIAWCRADYARARTASDTAVVDLRTPVVRREQAPASLSCGELRRAGMLADHRRP